MLESFKNIRIKFDKKGIQRDFILKSKESLGITNLKLAKKLKVHPRTLSDWARERFTMPQSSVKKLSQLANIPIPKNYSIIDLKDHLKKIGEKGGKKRILLYGKVTLNEEYRNTRWREWWKNIGQHKEKPEGFNYLIKIKIPSKDEQLAEFTGIMLGDGGIAPYHIHITLSDKEKEYTYYITNLIVKLFGVKPKIYKIKKAKAVDIVVQRKNLVNFCQEIGLVLGSKVKKQVDVPEWVKVDKFFLKACIRGLIDTDGCFYINSYCVNNKKYSYFKIAFTSSSLPLIQTVFTALTDFGINARISKNKKDVRIEGSQYVDKYINEIGSNNNKHLDKIKQWKNNSNMVK